MKSILLSCLLCINLLLHSQQFTTTVILEPQEPYRPIVKEGGHFFSLGFEMTGKDFSPGKNIYVHSIEIRKYADDMKLMNSVKLSGGEKLYGPLISMLRVINGTIYLLYYKRETAKEIQLFVSIVDPGSLEISAPTRLLNIEASGMDLRYYMYNSHIYRKNNLMEKTSGANGPAYYKTFFFEPSPDGSKIFALWNSGEDNQVFFSVIDKDGQVIRSGGEKLNARSDLAINSACVDNRGNLYISYSDYKKDGFQGGLLINTKTQTILKEISLPEGDPYGVFVGINPKEDKLFISGSSIVGNSLTGVYIQSLRLDNLQLGEVNQTRFPRDLIQTLEKEDFAGIKSGKDGLSHSIILDLYVMEDGTMNLIGEFRNRGETIGNHSYVGSGNILNVRFARSGPVFSRIPKARVSMQDEIGDSYRIFEFKNKIIVFYSDDSINLKRNISQPAQRSDRFGNAVLVTATINEDGLVKRETIVDQTNDGFVADTELMQQISKDSYYVNFQKIKGLGGRSKETRWVFINIR